MHAGLNNVQQTDIIDMREAKLTLIEKKTYMNTIYPLGFNI